MTNQQDHSPLDTVIDDVVRDMMQADGRSDLAGRVLRSIEEPSRKAWFSGVPALAAASVAVIVLVGAMLLPEGDQPAPVPSIEVIAGPPADLQSAVAAEAAPALPPPAGTARSGAPAATSESIFGPRRAQVGAASVRSVPQVRLALVLSDRGGDGKPRTETLTLVLPAGERRDGRAGAAGEPGLTVSATSEVLPSGAVRLTIAVLTPIERQLTVTLVPGTSTQLLEAVDSGTGRRITLDATATLVTSGSQR